MTDLSEKKTKNVILPKIDNGRNHLVTSARRREQNSQPYDPSDPLTLELHHGMSRQSVHLPTDSLDKSKKYYVTFTINQSPGRGGPDKTVSTAQATKKSK